MEKICKNQREKDRIIHSPLPGRIRKILVSEEEKVVVGQNLAYMDSMKMKNKILSTCDGVVGKVFVQEGSFVKENEAILEILCR